MNFISKNQIVSLFGTSFTFGLAIYWATETFIIKPLEKENIILSTNLKNSSLNIKTSKEYINQERKLIKAHTDIEYLNKQLKEYTVLLKENSNLKSKSEYLNESLKLCKVKLDELGKRTVILQRQASFYNELNQLQKDLKKAEQKLEEMIRFRHSFTESQIKNAELSIIRLEKQLKFLYLSDLRN